MKYECTEDRLVPGEWRVERIDHENEGACLVTQFSGPYAKMRAQEYARWKNEAISPPSPENRAIVAEIYRSLRLLGAEFDLLSTVGSWGDSLPESDVLLNLKAWNDATEAESAVGT